MPATVLFACIRNAGRSQMAAAWFNQLADPAKATAVSAGTQPGNQVHAEVVTVMREAGFDLARVKPQFLSDELAASVQYLVTMGCGEECPVVPGVKRLDWTLPDPKDQPVAEVRRIRDQVRAHVEQLIKTKGWAP